MSYEWNEVLQRGEVEKKEDCFASSWDNESKANDQWINLQLKGLIAVSESYFHFT